MDLIGPTFAAELLAAGVALDGIAWGADGVITFDDGVPQQVRDQVAAVYAAHDPARQPAPQNTAAALSAIGADRQLADLERAIDAGDTETALRTIHQLLQEK